MLLTQQQRLRNKTSEREGVRENAQTLTSSLHGQKNMAGGVTGQKIMSSLVKQNLTNCSFVKKTQETWDCDTSVVLKNVAKCSEK